MVTARNSLDKLTAGVSTRANLLTYFNSNLDIIDAAIAKCNFVAASDPTANDDSGDGYSAGSQWYNTTGHKVFVCENATSGSAIWRQIYPLTAGDLSGPAGATDGNIPLFDGATGKLLKNSAYSPASFAVAAKGVTNGDSHDHSGGDGAAIVAAATSFAATSRVLGRKSAGAGAGEECSITEILDLLGTAEWGDILYRGASAWAFLPHGTSGQVLQSGGHGADPSWGSSAGGAAFWTDVPGTPTRLSDTQFTITDTSNAKKYDKVFTKGTILTWLESSTFKTAMVVSSAYGTNTVYINIVGDSLTAGFTAMKYCIHRAQELHFILPGTIAVGTDLGRTHYATCDLIKLAVDVRVKTAGATNATTIDVNDDNTSIITTKPSISNKGTSDLDNVCDAPTTVIAAGSALTLDVDAVTTTPPVDLYAILYVYPEAWRYIA